MTIILVGTFGLCFTGFLDIFPGPSRAENDQCPAGLAFPQDKTISKDDWCATKSSLGIASFHYDFDFDAHGAFFNLIQSLKATFLFQRFLWFQ